MDMTIDDDGAPYFDKYSYGYLTIVSSSLLFYANNYWLMKFYTPEIVKNNAKREWKWRNIANSLIHSFITGLGACLCFWWTPEMREDLVNPINLVSHNLVSFSIGYFIYDLIDMAVNDRKSKTYELLLHHFMVILCFMTAMSGRTYQGYTLMALLVEVNSIFLHIRQIMILTDIPKTSIRYRINNSLNMGTFVVFRVLTLGWMSRWLIHNRNNVSPFDFYLGAVATVCWNMASVKKRIVSPFCYRHCSYVTTLNFYDISASAALPIIMVMNASLLHRLLRSDFFPIPRRPSSPSPSQSEENLKAR